MLDRPLRGPQSHIASVLWTATLRLSRLILPMTQLVPTSAFNRILPEGPRGQDEGVVYVTEDAQASRKGGADDNRIVTEILQKEIQHGPQRDSAIYHSSMLDLIPV